MGYDAITKAAIEVAAGNRLVMQDLVDLRAAIETKHPGAVARAEARRKKARFEAKFIGPVPEWAKRYVAKYGRANVSSLTVRQSRTKDYTSGHCWYSGGRLVVTFSLPGSDERERQASVLHEIAHALATYDDHGDRFYAKWYELLKAEGLYRYVLTCGQFVGVSSLKGAARRARC